MRATGQRAARILSTRAKLFPLSHGERQTAVTTLRHLVEHVVDGHTQDESDPGGHINRWLHPVELVQLDRVDGAADEGGELQSSQSSLTT
jgi:hypothetical protein